MSQKQTEQKPKGDKSRCCMECGDSHSKLHKVKKKDGTKGYLCSYCFKDYQNGYID